MRGGRGGWFSSKASSSLRPKRGIKFTLLWDEFDEYSINETPAIRARGSKTEDRKERGKEEETKNIFISPLVFSCGQSERLNSFVLFPSSSSSYYHNIRK
jgi:hypothetical protein